MSEVQNKRAHPRVDAKIDVQIRTGAEFAACYSQNISKGGIYLETEVLPDPNAIVELVLDLPPELMKASPKSITLKGRIVRLMTVTSEKRTIHKVAIQFLEIQPDIQLQLDRLYEQLAKDMTRSD